MSNPPKPSLVKRLEGNREKLGKDRVKVDPTGIGHIQPPTSLKADEKKLFLAVIAALPPDLLSRADEGIVERYAVAWARFRRCNADIRKQGVMVKRGRQLFRNPLIEVMDKMAREMHRAGGEIGLSPVARARMATAPMPDQDPMAALLGDDLDPSGAWSTPPREATN